MDSTTADGGTALKGGADGGGARLAVGPVPNDLAAQMDEWLSQLPPRLPWVGSHKQKRSNYENKQYKRKQTYTSKSDISRLLMSTKLTKLKLIN